MMEKLKNDISVICTVYGKDGSHTRIPKAEYFEIRDGALYIFDRTRVVTDVFACGEWDALSVFPISDISDPNTREAIAKSK